MDTMLAIETIGERTASEFLDRSQVVSAALTPITARWKLSLSSLTIDNVQDIRAQITSGIGKDCCSVYSFNLSDSEEYDKIHSLVEQAKQNNQNHRYPQINKPRDCEGSRCLYVGKSHSTSSRISQHLGIGYSKTFSLHLSTWAYALRGEIEFEILMFDAKDIVILPWLEDRLSVERRPILGRRGNR